MHGCYFLPVPGYEDYYPTLFHRDHRDFFVSVDHRYIYCDCRFHRFLYNTIHILLFSYRCNPNRNPNLTFENLVNCYLVHVLLIPRISRKSTHDFWSYAANKQTNKQKRQTKLVVTTVPLATVGGGIGQL